MNFSKTLKLLRRYKNGSWRGRLLLIIFALLALTAVTSSQITEKKKAEKPELRHWELLSVLSSVTLTNLDTKNAFALERVRTHRVVFSLAPHILKELKEAGASDKLIDAIRENILENRDTRDDLILTKGEIHMIKISPGEFRMGSVHGKANEAPVHLVTIKEPFWIGKYEVTFGQWKAIMGKLPAKFSDMDKKRVYQSDLQPVVYVSWNEINAFLQNLNSADTKYEYSLPSESEWEYVCRCGNSEWEFGMADFLTSRYANFRDSFYEDAPVANPATGIKVVGFYDPNLWGVYDMHGNVKEWCSDWFSLDYSQKSRSDGSPNSIVGDQLVRVTRGGSWTSSLATVRCASRGFARLNELNGRQSEGEITSSTAEGDLGFRLRATLRK